MPILISVLFILGIFLPTSIGGIINNNLSSYYFILLSIIYICLIYRFKKINITMLFIALGINLTLFFATLISPLTKYAFGSYPSYFAISLVFCINFKGIKFSKFFELVFLITNILVIFMIFLNSIQIMWIQKLILTYYSAYNQDIVPFMFLLNKPIFTFASHSIAGFFFFLLFFLCFEKYKQSNQILFLIMSFSYLYFMVLLKSNTAYIYLFIGIISVLIYFFRRKKLVTFLAVNASLVLFMIFSDNVSIAIAQANENITSIISSKTNGVLGRYGEEGNLSRDINFMKKNPFSPIGLSYSEDLTFGDSAFVEYLMKGSIPLLLLMYIGLYLFFKRNISDIKMVRYLFVIFLIFDVGYDSITFFRTLYILPLVVILLNNWRKKDQCPTANI